jgi:cytochrome d ubiquinol oxidase subunit II
MKNPLLFLILAAALAGLVLMRAWMGTGKHWRAWFASCLAIVGTTMFGVVGLYPAIIPSSLNPAWSLTVQNASSSPLTLKIMLGVAVAFVPIVILYQAWVYKTFSHRITDEDLASDEAY